MWQQVERAMGLWTTVDVDIRHVAGQFSQAAVELYEGDGAAAFRRLDSDWRRWMALPFMRMALQRASSLSVHGLAALSACRSVGPDRRLLDAAASDARGLRALRLPWTCALAQILDAGAALVAGARAEAREQLERAHARAPARLARVYMPEVT